MTTTPPDAPAGPPPQDSTGSSGPRVGRDQVRDLGRLRRSRTDRKVAGVAGGLARHLDVDPLILRVAFVVLVFFGGAGLILYAAAWLLVPEDGSDRAAINLDERSRSVALVIVGLLSVLALIGDSWGAFGFPWPLTIVALVALWLLTRSRPSAPTTAQPAPAAPAQEYQYGTDPQPAAAYYSSQPTAYDTSAAARVPNPRKRGPILFWFTLALVALSEGLLGIVDLAGAGVADPAYPALAVAICGVMLVVGAFFGRAGGIILLGLIATVGLTVATAADQWEGDRNLETPATAAAVDDRYWLGAGEQIIDLREVADLEALDGRTIEVEGGVGRIEVILPDDLSATVRADIDGPGSIELFDEETGGIEISENAFDGDPQDPRITIDAQIGLGQIEVHR